MATVESPAVARTNGSAATIAVENPATGETIAHVPDMGASEIDALVVRARAAQPAWEALGYEGRAEVMYEARRWLIQNRERMITTLMEECGKTHEDAQLSEIGYMADAFGFWAKNAPKYLKDERLRLHSPLLLGKKVVIRHRPYGVVGVIGPWNFPLILCFGDAVPALMAGNTAVLKPSEVTPLSTLFMAEGLRAAGMPEDVALVATGGGETGAALVDSVDMVMFTGSVRTGKRIMAQAAETLTPVSLELGGKDPMIVLEDADVERAANAAVYYGFLNSGQICQSVERVYVTEPVYENFVGKVVEKTQKLRQGEPGEPGSVDVGAMTFENQIDIVERHIEDAVEKGAQVRTGGKRKEGDGRFWEPTVLTGVDHSMECMTEETFGPTLPIMKVKDGEEALRLSNDSSYGLSSSVWTKDVAKGEAMARRMEAGNACVNDAIVSYLALEAPFGGSHESGIGARHGIKGIQKYCQTQTLLVTRFAPKREIHFFPYSRRVTKLIDRLNVLQFGRGPKRKK
ncbi:MAG: aldehyde dehydrogenase family protein [Thermoleophilaceae bacterium]|nr:aldehyde dehydrogenase family protein [Thermoleophilaceae bacterium]